MEGAFFNLLWCKERERHAYAPMNFSLHGKSFLCYNIRHSLIFCIHTHTYKIVNNISFPLQVELMRNLEDRDDQYKTLLDEKLQISDNSHFIEADT